MSSNDIKPIIIIIKISAWIFMICLVLFLFLIIPAIFSRNIEFMTFVIFLFWCSFVMAFIGFSLSILYQEHLPKLKSD